MRRIGQNNQRFLRIENTWVNQYHINSIKVSSLKEGKEKYDLTVYFTDGVEKSEFEFSTVTALKTAINGLTNEMFLEKDDTPF
jgi:hypothetical protein